MTARDPNRMNEAVTKLAGVFADNAGMTITYAQGNVSVTLTATVGRTPFQVLDGEVMIAYESRDFIVQAADFVNSQGTPIVPASGDTVTDVSGKVYVVAAPKPLNVYESIGQDGTVLSIHTKGVS
jgi:hypothetical protein